MNNFEGPLPDEALPAGEDTLTEDELSQVSELFFSLEEGLPRRDFASFSGLSQDVIDQSEAARNQFESDAFEIYKAAIISNRD